MRHRGELAGDGFLLILPRLPQVRLGRKWRTWSLRQQARSRIGEAPVRINQAHPLETAQLGSGQVLPVGVAGKIRRGLLAHPGKAGLRDELVRRFGLGVRHVAPLLGVIDDGLTLAGLILDPSQRRGVLL